MELLSRPKLLSEVVALAYAGRGSLVGISPQIVTPVSRCALERGFKFLPVVAFDSRLTEMGIPGQALGLDYDPLEIFRTHASSWVHVPVSPGELDDLAQVAAINSLRIEKEISLKYLLLLSGLKDGLVFPKGDWGALASKFRKFSHPYIKYFEDSLKMCA